MRPDDVEHEDVINAQNLKRKTRLTGGEMSGSIDSREYANYMQFTLSGDQSLDFAVRAWKRVGEDTERKGLKRALVISKTNGRLSSGDMNQLGSRVSQYLRGFKIALVGEESGGRHLAEALSRQSGCDAREFRSPHQAEDWLERG